MAALLFADTNLLVYCLDPAVPGKRERAARVLNRGMLSGVLVTSPQSLNECYQALAFRRRLVPRDDARAFVSALMPTCRAPLDAGTVTLAWEAETLTNYSWWDCLLLASAIRAGCTRFLSEDLADGQVVAGVKIVNPFTHNLGDLFS